YRAAEGRGCARGRVWLFLDEFARRHLKRMGGLAGSVAGGVRHIRGLPSGFSHRALKALLLTSTGHDGPPSFCCCDSIPPAASPWRPMRCISDQEADPEGDHRGGMRLLFHNLVQEIMSRDRSVLDGSGAIQR